MTSDIQSALTKLQQAHAISETSTAGAAKIVLDVVKDLVDALVLSNTLGPDPDNEPVDSRKSGGGD
jgi:hypothetical protein